MKFRVIFLLVFVSSLVLATDHSYAKPKPPSKEAFIALSSLQTGTDRLDAGNIRSLEHYSYREVADALIERLEFELNKTEFSASEDVIDAALTTIATVANKDYALKLTAVLTAAQSNPTNSKPWLKNLHEGVLLTISKISNIHSELPEMGDEFDPNRTFADNFKLAMPTEQEIHIVQKKITSEGRQKALNDLQLGSPGEAAEAALTLAEYMDESIGNTLADQLSVELVTRKNENLMLTLVEIISDNTNFIDASLIEDSRMSVETDIRGIDENLADNLIERIDRIIDKIYEAAGKNQMPEAAFEVTDVDDVATTEVTALLAQAQFSPAASAQPATTTAEASEKVKEELRQKEMEEAKERFNKNLHNLTSKNDEVVIEAAKRLRIFRLKPSVSAQLTRLVEELAKNSENSNPTIINILIESLLKVGTQEFVPSMKMLIELAEQTHGSTAFFKQTLKRMLDKSIAMMTDRTPYPDMQNNSDERGQVMRLEAHKLVEEKLRIALDIVIGRGPDYYLDHFKSNLEKRIKGQPEVINNFTRKYHSDLILGFREMPNQATLMGEKGTGKKAAAEALADAIHHKIGAHEKHLFTIEPLRKDSDLGTLLGSPTGYIGSTDLSRFVRFVANHSGGRYIIKQEAEAGQKAQYYIDENPEWKGEDLEGFYPASSGVVRLKDFQDWSKENKDAILTSALDSGYIFLKNPKGNVEKIQANVTFVISTLEGSGITSSREPNGERYSDPLEYQQRMEKWEPAHKQPILLKDALLSSNGGINSSGGKDEKGISETLVGLLNDTDVLLVRPMAIPHLKEIAQTELEAVSNKLSRAKGSYGQISLEWTPEVVDFVQEYNFVSENNAQPIAPNVENLVQETINDAFESRDIPPSNKKRVIHLDVIENEDNTYTLSFTVKSKSAKVLGQFEKLVTRTEIDKPARPISDERIDEILKIPEQMKKRVFGIDHILDQLGDALLAVEDGRAKSSDPDRATKPATTFTALGKTSTGKSETPKVLAELYLKDKSAHKVFDFHQVRSMDDIKHMLLGSKKANGEPIKSEFMKMWDRTNGRFVAVFDEAINDEKKELLKSMFDILREPVVTTFSDGKPRPMGQMIFFFTGNGGEEWYDFIPADLPDIMRQTAMLEIYKMMMNSQGARRKTLKRYLSDAFLARSDERNTFFYPPLSFKAIRELTQLKLKLAIEELQAKPDQRGWNIVFKNREQYKEVLTTLEHHAFKVDDQGASIEAYVRKQFQEKLRNLLLKNKIEGDTEVVIALNKSVEGKVEEVGGKSLEVFQLLVKTTDGQTLTLKLSGREVVKPFKFRDEDRILTAYHEAGHELGRKILFDDVYNSEMVSILPGVTQISGQAIVYAGLAQSSPNRQFRFTRDFVVREIAVLAAGEVAQMLVSKGERTDEGNHNDMTEAYALAEKAVLRWGLSPKWGSETIPNGETVTEYLKSKDDAGKKLARSEVNKLVKEGVDLITYSLRMNFDNALIPFATQLAVKGILNKPDLKEFYSTHEVIRETDPEYKKSLRTWKGPALASRLSKIRYRTVTRDAELLPQIPLPESIADIDEIYAKSREEEVKDVDLPSNLSFLESSLGTEANPCGQAIMASQLGPASR